MLTIMKDDNPREILSSLGKRISIQRKKRGITLEKLAYGMEISKGNLSDIEHGKRDPRFTTLQAIAEGLDISVSQLLRDF
jgi:transcriptional regulator with XRE-family HTH domain